MNWTFALIVTLAVCVYWTAVRWWCAFVIRHWFYKRWAFPLYFWSTTLVGALIVHILATIMVMQ